MNTYIQLLQKMIATPSFSREENLTADLLAAFLSDKGVAEVHRQQNNVWAYNRHFDSSKPTILLNSHHDTVKPNSAYTRDPFRPDVEEGRLYGLGSNDAGASVVALTAAFLHFYPLEGLKYNLCLALTAEEEVSGQNGIESILPQLGELSFAMVGEPTQMQMAIAERGLMVLDCVAHGRAGHAARDEGDNAIYRALQDIEWFRTYRFPETSPLLGDVKMSVTIVHAGTQHNVVPDQCTFTVDVRSNENYSNEDIFRTVRAHVGSEVKARSTRLNSSATPMEHPIVQRILDSGRTPFGSPTLSDQAQMPFPTLKIGPGASARSHTANEYVLLQEIDDAIELYVQWLNQLSFPKCHE